MLSGSLTDAQALPLFVANVVVGKDEAASQAKRDALVKEHGSVSKAYTAWLWGYIDGNIVPSNFRK